MAAIMLCLLERVKIGEPDEQAAADDVSQGDRQQVV
jgi:hypothetical protein